MIVRANRSPSRYKSKEHRRLAVTIEELQRENKELRMQVLQLEQRLQQSETAKKKYKLKYREAKQKVEILGLVGLARARTPEANCSPHTKNTRIKTMSQEEFTSVTAHIAQSELDDHLGSPYTEHEEKQLFQFRKFITPPTTIREIEKEDPKILNSIVKIHQQLEKLTQQIVALEEKGKAPAGVGEIENQLYRRMEEVVERLNRIQMRDLERENQRLSREKEREAKRQTSTLKAMEKIGRDLLDFKIDE